MEMLKLRLPLRESTLRQSVKLPSTNATDGNLLPNIVSSKGVLGNNLPKVISDSSPQGRQNVGELYLNFSMMASRIHSLEMIIQRNTQKPEPQFSTLNKTQLNSSLQNPTSFGHHKKYKIGKKLQPIYIQDGPQSLNIENNKNWSPIVLKNRFEKFIPTAYSKMTLINDSHNQNTKTDVSFSPRLTSKFNTTQNSGIRLLKLQQELNSEMRISQESSFKMIENAVGPQIKKKYKLKTQITDQSTESMIGQVQVSEDDFPKLKSQAYSHHQSKTQLKNMVDGDDSDQSIVILSEAKMKPCLLSPFRPKQKKKSTTPLNEDLSYTELSQ